MIAIVDYGAGNIFSVKNALDYLGCDSILTSRKEDLENADSIILPGVGAFPAAMKKLGESGLVDTIKQQAKQKPFLGICLGMQLLFEKSFEFEECAGLALVKGYVDKMVEPELVIPHMGWNKLEIQNDCALLKKLPEEAYVYFVHSYMATCQDEKNLSAWVEYGGKVPALVTDNKYVFGAQFHPEKSGDVGLQILRNFANL